MRRCFDNKGQQSIGISFGMIFSIFLIIVFVIISFIAVKGFLDIGGTSSVGLFYKELQTAVDSSWKGQSSEKNFKINLPSEIKKICFGNLTAKITSPLEDYEEIKDFEVYEANVFLVPPEKANGIEWNLIKHIDLDKITENSNPYCVNVNSGLVIKKGFYDKKVLIQ